MVESRRARRCSSFETRRWSSLVLAAGLVLALAACDSGQTQPAAGGEAGTEGGAATGGASEAAAGGASEASGGVSEAAGGASEDAGGASEAATGGSEAAAAGGDGPVSIAYLQKQGDQQYFVDQARGAQEAAAELGADLSVVNLGTDANLAISELDTAIAQQVDGIAIVVPDQQIGPQVISSAEQAGIPLVASDDVIEGPEGEPAPFVGFNGAAMGEQVGLEAARLYTEAGWDPASTRIISSYQQDLSVCTDRIDAALEAFQSEVPEAPEVVELGTDNSVVDAQNKTGALVTANPGVENWVVWGCNDENVQGVTTALANAGYGPDTIVGVGLGAYLACLGWGGGQEGLFDSALFISGEEVGRTAVTVLHKAITSGEPLPEETIANTEMVGPDTWEDAGVVCG